MSEIRVTQVQYHYFPNARTTVCCATTEKEGYLRGVVIGKSENRFHWLEASKGGAQEREALEDVKARVEALNQIRNGVKCTVVNNLNAYLRECENRFSTMAQYLGKPEYLAPYNAVRAALASNDVSEKVREITRVITVCAVTSQLVQQANSRTSIMTPEAPLQDYLWLDTLGKAGSDLLASVIAWV